ncbi:PTS transporter subunit EIIC [Vagococcus intermedius]|uniref:PTS transporter subunit EIIC n=1 Tax=Vagococcus intermedius TaxID=2991418 RepID=A0AAF0CVH4_9ENTE|nr:PTS transporter subunit EIIC [Vagococcus intermedius]WEG73477.1 PTS transporter subunit EIIC [Vagococcus intermedius]WEG75560.1 PTS transporter subunit EIIC [Vagococcus intermedius]
MKEAMQKFSRSAIIPVKFMAVMGLFLAFSVIMQLEVMPSFIQQLGLLIKSMMDGMLNNLALIFCIAITSSMAKKNKMEAGVLSVIVFLIFLAANNAWLTTHGMLAKEGAMGLYGTGQGYVLGFQVVDMNVFLGMILGCVTAYIHNKFSEKQFIDMLSIYAGPRLAFIIMIPITLVLAIILSYVWPVINNGIESLSGVILGAGLFGVFLYGFGNRFLIPTGLHHLLWMPFCFTAIGGTAEINGQMYTGAVNIFYAEMANVGTITTLDPSLRFALFGFSKVFACIPIALALIHCAKKSRKDEVKGMVLPAAFVGTVAGITEALDFTFLFASPLLWFVHSLLAGFSEALIWGLGIRTFVKDGIIDTVVSNSVFSPSLTKVYLFVLVGLVMSVVWYVVFVFLIKKFNLKTPGREEELAVVGVNGQETNVASINEAQVNQQGDIDLVISGLGGAENIEEITNCFTRLRVEVKEPEKVDKVLLEKISLCKGVVMNEKNVQVIIGMGVQPFKEEVCEALGLE